MIGLSKRRTSRNVRLPCCEFECEVIAGRLTALLTVCPRQELEDGQVRWALPDRLARFDLGAAIPGVID